MQNCIFDIFFWPTRNSISRKHSKLIYHRHAASYRHWHASMSNNWSRFYRHFKILSISSKMKQTFVRCFNKYFFKGAIQSLKKLEFFTFHKNCKISTYYKIGLLQQSVKIKYLNMVINAKAKIYLKCTASVMNTA